MDVEVYNIDNTKIKKQIILGKGLKYSKCNIDVNNVLGYELSDTEIKDFLFYKYLKNGIIPKIIIHEDNHDNHDNYYNHNDIDTNDVNNFYIRYDVPNHNYHKLMTINLLLPDNLIDKINTYLKFINNYLILIEQNIKNLNNNEIHLMEKQNTYRLNKPLKYITNYNKFSKLREFINFIKNELYTEFSYLYTRFLKLKYDTILYYEIEYIIEQFYNYESELNKISIPFFFKNNDDIVEFKISNGDFDMKKLLEMIYENINSDFFVLYISS